MFGEHLPQLSQQMIVLKYSTRYCFLLCKKPVGDILEMPRNMSWTKGTLVKHSVTWSSEFPLILM